MTVNVYFSSRWQSGGDLTGSLNPFLSLGARFWPCIISRQLAFRKFSLHGEGHETQCHAVAMHTFTTVAFKTSVLSFIGFGELIRDGGELLFGEDVFERPSPLGIER